MSQYEESNENIVKVAVINGKIWFVYTKRTPVENQNKSVKWLLVSYDTNTKELLTHAEFMSDRYAYEQVPQERYDEACAYYYNGIIVMTDRDRLLEYDAVNNRCVEMDYTDYPFPETVLEKTNHYSLRLTDGEQAVFIRNEKTGECRLFDAEAGINSSKAFREMMDLTGLTGWSGSSVFEGAYLDMTNGTYYIVLWLEDSYGRQYAAAFEYDFERNACKYAGYCRHDNINYVSLIPVENSRNLP